MHFFFVQLSNINKKERWNELCINSPIVFFSFVFRWNCLAFFSCWCFIFILFFLFVFSANFFGNSKFRIIKQNFMLGHIWLPQINSIWLIHVIRTRCKCMLFENNPFHLLPIEFVYNIHFSISPSFYWCCSFSCSILSWLFLLLLLLLFYSNRLATKLSPHNSQVANSIR